MRGDFQFSAGAANKHENAFGPYNARAAGSLRQVVMNANAKIFAHPLGLIARTAEQRFALAVINRRNRIAAETHADAG